MTKLTVGDPAPDFTLPGTDGSHHRDYTLAEFRGVPVVLVFYPADNSPVCTVQLGNYNDNIAAFGKVGAQVLALSPQSIDSHDEFHAAHETFGFPLLSDKDKVVGRLYGALGPLGFYRRTLVVVGPDGHVAYVHRSLTSMGFQPADAIVEAIEDIQQTNS
jgi:thioredoxin-dependent peroxiredoxin